MLHPLGVLALSGMLLTVSGCSGVLSSSGPSARAITQEAGDVQKSSVPYQLVDLSAQSITPYLRAPERTSTRKVLPASVPEIRFVPGDVLTVTIADNTLEAPLFAPLANGGTVFNDVRIDSQGDIRLPYIGAVHAAGGTPYDVEARILASLKGRATAPVARVVLSGDISGSVLVAGAVKTPGRVSALKGPLTLLDAVNGAGGPVLEPHLIRVVLRTNQEVRTYNYDELLHDVNPVIPPHSEIIVERDRKRFVAMGAVGEPGLHDLPSDNPSLLETLGSVGGLKDRLANASGVFVFRTERGEQGQAREAQVFRLDMGRPEAVFLAGEFLVKPGDAVYVTNAAVYEWEKIISPIAQAVVLGRYLSDY